MASCCLPNGQASAAAPHCHGGCRRLQVVLGRKDAIDGSSRGEDGARELGVEVLGDFANLSITDSKDMTVRIVVRPPVLRLGLATQLDNHEIAFSDHAVDRGPDPCLQLAEYWTEKLSDEIGLTNVGA